MTDQLERRGKGLPNRRVNGMCGTGRHKLENPDVMVCPDCRKASQHRFWVRKREERQARRAQFPEGAPLAPPRLFTVFASDLRAGKCGKGHDLTGPGAVVVGEGRRKLCTACRAESGWVRHGRRVNGMCGAGRHKLPVPAPEYCGECRTENNVIAKQRQKERRAAAKARDTVELKALFSRDLMPKMAVLESAACTPAEAWLFDPITREEQSAMGPALIAARLAKATSVCKGCPVAELCGADAVNHARSGVYGGMYFRDGRTPPNLFGRPASGKALRPRGSTSRYQQPA